MTIAEEQQIATLDRQIAELKSTDTAEVVAELKQAISDLQVLEKKLDAIDQTLSDTEVGVIRELLSQWHSQDRLTKKLGVEQFRTEGSSQAGTESWRVFIEAAHALAELESDQPYPQEDSRCLLCQQPLSSSARDLLHRLWAYAKSDAENQLAQLNRALTVKCSALQELDIDLLNEQAVAARQLQPRDPQLLLLARAYLASCQVRRDAIVSMILDRVNSLVLPELAQSPASQVQAVVTRLEYERTELEGRSRADEIARLTKQKLELEHRQLLGQHLIEIEKFVADSNWRRTFCATIGETKSLGSLV